MSSALVGYTGFVGSNLCFQHKFDYIYNHSNIRESFGTNPDLLVYCGVPAQKFLANKNPEEDFAIIEDAINNIKMINPKTIVLISTIDVYKNPVDVDETEEIIQEDLEAYGRNRYYLEKWVKENYKNYLIVHLPALYGKNLKKNFLYDLIHIIPSMIKEDKFLELCGSDSYIEKFYQKLDNGFYKYDFTTKGDERELKKHFQSIGFTALDFTDSRASYQFYNLEKLWKHIEMALANDIKILNLATEPVTASEVYSYVKNGEFVNEIFEAPAKYDFKTVYSELFGGRNGYIFDKNFVLEDIKKFVEEQEENA